MAKLDVKVIDMQGGEITKVAYDGAEYAKIADDFKDAQTGDLFLSGGGMDETEGAFYAINCEDRGDGHPIKFVDDAGDKNGYVKEAPYPLFRKVSAQTTPTIEERVTALETDVAAIKGESKPAPYEPKVGDIVKITRDQYGDAVGTVVEIVDIEEGIRVTYKSKKSLTDTYAASLDAIKPATAEEVAKHRETEKWAKIGRKPNEYKVGDIIEYGAYGKFGKIPKYRKVAKIDGNEVRYFEDKYKNETEWMPADSESIRLIAPVESTLN